MNINSISRLVLTIGAAGLFSGIMPPGALPAFVKNSQDPQNESRPTSQDPNDHDQDRQEQRTPQNSPEEYQPISLPEGTIIPVRLADDVNSNHDKAGALFTGTVDPSVLINDIVVIPRGTEAHIRMVEAKKGGHIHGKAKVRLELVSLIMNGQRLGVDTDAPSKQKGAVGAKASAVAKKGEKSGGATIAAGATGMDPTSVAGPVIAAFAAAKVEVKAGSRIQFRLESPFTFEKPPVTSPEQH